MCRSFGYFPEYRGGGPIDEWDTYIIDKTNDIAPLQLLLYPSQICSTKEFATLILPATSDHKPNHFDETKFKEDNLLLGVSMMQRIWTMTKTMERSKSDLLKLTL